MPKFKKYTPAQKRAYAKRKKTAQSKFKLRRPSASVINKLQPIIETKKFCGYTGGSVPGPEEIYLSLEGPATTMTPGAFMAMQHHRGGSVPSSESVYGNDIFSRFLSTKVMVQYPPNAYQPENTQVRPIELIWGWCKPTCFTPSTTPARGAPTRQNLHDHVLHQIAEDFDEETDSMTFKTRTRRQYNIVGRVKMKPNMNNSIIQNQSQWSSTMENRGGPPAVKRTVSWKMNKKVEYSESLDTGAIYPLTPEPFVYPNQAYIPFIVFFNPDYDFYDANTGEGEAFEQHQISVTTNSCHWFNDA